MHGKNQRLNIREVAAHMHEKISAAFVAQRQVDQHDVHMHVRQVAEDLGNAASRTGHLHIRLHADKRGEAVPNQRVIIDNVDVDFGTRPRGFVSVFRHRPFFSPYRLRSRPEHT